MQKYLFIFSDERSYRIKRHLFFWASWWLFYAIMYSFSPVWSAVSYSERLVASGIEAFFYLASHVFLAYTLMYAVIPKLVLKGKYLGAAVATTFVFLFTACISAFIGVVVLKWFWSLSDNVFGKQPHTYQSSFFSSLLAGLRGAITVGGIAAAIKLMKYWYVKEQNNLLLQKQNLQSQLAILKAQIHPHFLFNTLNNIYSHTQIASAEASKLVMGLSDMLRYIIYECNVSLVPLKKELKMLLDYITLEQIRYNYQLDISIDVPKHPVNLQISPLLLLPFVENCFKHGASQMLENPWISLTISIENEELTMKLVNATSKRIGTGHKGIGISNVRKRLELIYPNKHELRVSHKEDVFIVDLKLQLEKAAIMEVHTAEPTSVYD